MIEIKSVEKVANITEKFSYPNLFNSLINIIPTALCIRYQEKEIKPILDIKRGLK